MAMTTDRMRFKDKLVDNVSKSIKSIQGFLYNASVTNAPGNSEESTLVIDNSNNACHKLLDSLDNALLHGVRNVTHGYWRVVKELSHKGMVKEIETLPNVTTDLGRGRAWLHASLNEGLLESYIRLLTTNEKLLKKRYAKDSLVMDTDDLPYLDLSPSPPRSKADFQDEDDSSSIKSFSSHRSSFSESRLTSPTARAPMQSDSDSTSIGSFDVQSPQGECRSSSALSLNDGTGLTDATAVSKPSAQSCAETYFNGKDVRTFTPDLGKVRSITPTDSTSISSYGSTGDVDRHKRLESIMLENDPDLVEDTLEVIHVRSKKSGSASKAKKKKQRSSNMENSSSLVKSRANSHNNVPSEKDSADSCRLKSGNKVHKKPSDDRDSHRDSLEAVPSSIQPSQVECDYDASGLSTSFQNSSQLLRSDLENKDLALGTDSVIGNVETITATPVSSSAFSEIEQRIEAMCQLEDVREETASATSENTTVSVSVIDDKLENSLKDQQKLNSDNDDKVNTHVLNERGSKVDSALPSKSMSNNYTSEPTVTQPPVSRQDDDASGAHQNPNGERCTNEQEADDNFDFYSSSFHDRDDSFRNEELQHSKDSKMVNEKTEKMANFHKSSHLQDYMDYILKGPDSPDAAVAVKEAPPDMSSDLFVSLDNNMKLQVMLDIFKQEDENFVKMFVCWENHTEGDPTVAYVLVSDQYLYILHFKKSNRKFTVQSTTRLIDIIFISTGLYEQTMNIESRDKSRQKQRLWLTPGHQSLSQAIVECLTDAVKKAMENFASVQTRFSVGSDVPLQKIGIRKYLSKFVNCESHEISISDYSLVYWEDPSSSPSGGLDTVTKEGTLLLYTQDPVKGYIWKPVYVVLKSGMLCISNKKSDLKPHSYLGLGGDQCIGCRRTSLGEREHCVELVLAEAGSWFLSAATASEVVDWSHALCLAVSQGTQEEGSLKDCTPCCCVLACNKIIMCHEDLHTRFFRTLGLAQVEDVTGISVDEHERTYCIVEFESTEAGVSSGQWVFYFAAASDANRFISALDSCWKDIYQVEIPVTVLSNVTLQHHCHSQVKHLRNALSLL